MAVAIASLLSQNLKKLFLAIIGQLADFRQVEGGCGRQKLGIEPVGGRFGATPDLELIERASRVQMNSVGNALFTRAMLSDQ